MDTACFTYEGLPVLMNQQPCDYKPPVWILGKQYDGKYDGIKFCFISFCPQRILFCHSLYCHTYFDIV
jgi:hypothetical protein